MLFFKKKKYMSWGEYCRKINDIEYWGFLGNTTLESADNVWGKLR